MSRDPRHKQSAFAFLTANPCRAGIHPRRKLFAFAPFTACAASLAQSPAVDPSIAPHHEQFCVETLSTCAGSSAQSLAVGRRITTHESQLTNHGVSNRNWCRIEIAVTYSKQTPATLSNRNCLRGLPRGCVKHPSPACPPQRAVCAPSGVAGPWRGRALRQEKPAKRPLRRSYNAAFVTATYCADSRACPEPAEWAQAFRHFFLDSQATGRGPRITEFLIATFAISEFESNLSKQMRSHFSNRNKNGSFREGPPRWTPFPVVSGIFRRVTNHHSRLTNRGSFLTLHRSLAVLPQTL
jgi:hypothetical protein